MIAILEQVWAARSYSTTDNHRRDDKFIMHDFLIYCYLTPKNQKDLRREFSKRLRRCRNKPERKISAFLTGINFPNEILTIYSEYLIIIWLERSLLLTHR